LAPFKLVPLVTSTKYALSKQWDKFEWRQAERAYRASLIEQYSTVRILGKPDPVKLEGIFTDIYILDKLTAWLRFDIDELGKRGEDRFDLRRQEQTRINGLKTVQK